MSGFPAPFRSFGIQWLAGSEFKVNPLQLNCKWTLQEHGVDRPNVLAEKPRKTRLMDARKKNPIRIGAMPTEKLLQNKSL